MKTTTITTTTKTEKLLFNTTKDPFSRFIASHHTLYILKATVPQVNKNSVIMCIK